MSRTVLSGGKEIGGTASLASVCKFVEFTFIGILKIDNTPKTYDFSTSCRRTRQALKTRGTPTVFLKLLEIKRLMFGIPFEPSIDRVARLAYSDLPHQKVCQKVNQCGDPQRTHGIDR